MGRTTPAEKFADSTGGLAGLGDASFKGWGRSAGRRW